MAAAEEKGRGSSQQAGRRPLMLCSRQARKRRCFSSFSSRTSPHRPRHGRRHFLTAARQAAQHSPTHYKVFLASSPSETGDTHTPVTDRWDCPPPRPALLTQDSMPRERRHMAGVTWEGGSVVLSCALGRIPTTSLAFRGFVLMTSFLALRASVCIFLWCLFNYFARFGSDGTATWMEQLPGLDTAARMEHLPG